MSQSQGIQASFRQRASALSSGSQVTPVKRDPPTHSGAVDPPEPYLVGRIEFQRPTAETFTAGRARFMALLGPGY